jgi:hypothetical protein
MSRDRDTTTRHVRLLVSVLAVVALSAAACGGSNGPGVASGGSSSPSNSAPQSVLVFSACMRSQGVPNFPDPGSNGNLPKPDAPHLGVSSSQLQAAQHACQHLLPNDGGAINADSISGCMMASDCPPALVQQVLNEESNFAQCMRSHGVPNWPDPSIDSQGRPVFVISISKNGFDPYSPPIWAKGNACSHLMPGLPGLPAAVSP